MAIASTSLRAAALHHPLPGPCLTSMNEYLVEKHASGMYVTLFYGILNTRTGVLDFSNAGHNPPYVFSPDGELRPLKDRCGPMLGLFEGFEYPTRTTELRPGDGLLVFTDGVTEARNREGEFYENSRLEAYLTASASRPVLELVRGLQSEVENFEAGAPRGDDITALALRRSVP
jgi:sigma-B regulation protein RsbU (phosphoserine phosphatase)